MKNCFLSFILGLFLVGCGGPSSVSQDFSKAVYGGDPDGAIKLLYFPQNAQKMVIKSLFREKSIAWLLNNLALASIMVGLKVSKQ